VGNARRKAMAARHARRRRMITIGVVIALLVGAGLIYFFVVRDSSTSPSAAGGNAAEAFEGGSTELVYADFADSRDLHRLDLEDGADEVVGELPRSGQTDAGPGSTWVVIQIVDEEDGRLVPGLYLYDTEADEEVRLGVGFEPAWSADGSHLAYVVPEDPSQCGEEACNGPRRVAVVDVAAPEPQELTEVGENNVIGWAGDHVVIQNEDQPGSPIAQTVSLDGAVEDLPMLPREFWGASPDGRWAIQSDEDGARFFAMSNGRVEGEGVEIGIPDGTELGTGGWAHDSSMVASTALDDDGVLQLVTFSPDDPEPATMAPGGESSVVDVLWTPDNDAFVFQRFTGEELEAVHCSVGDPDSCDVLLSWTRGITLLRIE